MTGTPFTASSALPLSPLPLFPVGCHLPGRIRRLGHDLTPVAPACLIRAGRSPSEARGEGPAARQPPSTGLKLAECERYSMHRWESWALGGGKVAVMEPVLAACRPAAIAGGFPIDNPTHDGYTVHLGLWTLRHVACGEPCGPGNSMSANNAFGGAYRLHKPRAPWAFAPRGEPVGPPTGVFAKQTQSAIKCCNGIG
jgi:hypothetical protein